MGLLSQIGKLTRNQARSVRMSQLGGSRTGANPQLGPIDDYMHPYLQRQASKVTGGDVPNIGATGMTETETEVVRMLQSGMSKEQIAQNLYQGGVDPRVIEIYLNKAQRKLMGAGELF